MEAQKEYLAQKKQKKQSAVKVLWLLITLAIIFIVIIGKLALSEDNNVNTVFSGIPSNNEVYTVAKQFVLPTLKGSGAKFSEDGYQYGKKSDSVFVIRSVVETKTDTGDPIKTNYEIMLKYKGGPVNDQKNWDVLDLKED